MKTFVRLIRRYVLAAVSIVVLLLFLGIGLIAVARMAGRAAAAPTDLRFHRYCGRYDKNGGYTDVRRRTHAGRMDGWLCMGHGAGRSGTYNMELCPARRIAQNLHRQRHCQLLPLVSAGLSGVLPCDRLWAVCHRPAQRKPVAVQPVQLAGRPAGSGAQHFLHSARVSAVGTGLLFLAGMAGHQTASNSGCRSGYPGPGQDCAAAHQRVYRRVGRKAKPTSSHLQQKNEMLARRDDARTQWIAGVSHDVRTPLALILGWSEQLEQNAALPDTARQKAAGIRTQSEKLRSLIDDLNLTSKLEYGAQPLRKERFTAGPLFRELVAQLYDSPLAEKCEISLHQSDAAEHAQILVDRALLGRLLENLISNSVRHSGGNGAQSNVYNIIAPVRISIQIDVVEEMLHLTLADNGKGYPETVLAALSSGEIGENTPHILGLHVVEQIAEAHGGKATFGQNTPCGAKAVVELPTE